MVKRVAVVQSNYIPWKGYFDLINRVDEFVLYDDAQYTRRDWRNRNRIKTPDGPTWLTIPVETKGRYLAPIKEITISNGDWARLHWRSLLSHYSRARYFREFAPLFEELYLSTRETRLSAVNFRFLTAVCKILGIGTRLSWSMDYLGEADASLDKTERLVAVCRRAGASVYLSGPSARAYLDPASFTQAGISLEFMDYAGYPEYEQPYPPFAHDVSIVDLIFNVGPDAPRYMLSLGGGRREARPQAGPERSATGPV